MFKKRKRLTIYVQVTEFARKRNVISALKREQFVFVKKEDTFIR